jgi:hypothetical protein
MREAVTVHRRLFLQAAAGTLATAWIGPAGAAPGQNGAAPDPWTAWTPEALRGHDDPRVRAIAHAILVPNPQNLQPWLCDLSRPDHIVLRNSGERRLAVSDYPDRQLTVGFGTFAELLVLALEAEGLTADLALFPEGESWPCLDARPVADFRLTPAAPRRDPLLDQILARHTNRTPFDLDRPVLATELTQIRAAARLPERVHVNQEPDIAQRIQDITLRAWDMSMVEFAPTRIEVARWTHIGNEAIAAAPYGPFVSDAALAKAAGPVTLETLSDPDSAQLQANRAAYRKAVETGQAHLWIVSPAYDRKGMFEAGRDWVRTHLKATALGLDMQPHSQALQDFAAIDPFVRELHEALGVPPPGRIEMLGRIGHGSSITPSPRATVVSHLIA